MDKIHQQINDYLKYLVVFRNTATTTLSQKRTILLYFVKITEIREISEITNVVFSRWVEFLENSALNPNSINSYNSIIIAMLRYYQESGDRISLNLAFLKKLKPKEVRHIFYSREEISRVIDSANFETGLMIRIMFETGMRIAELVRLKADDIDKRRICFIGKGGKSREVYITNETLQSIKRYIAQYDLSGFLWCVSNGVPAQNGEPPTINTVRQRMKEAFLAAGIQDFHPHALRHSFATDLQRSGASVAEIKEMMGHSNISTTERYLHNFDGRLQELFDKYR